MEECELMMIKKRGKQRAGHGVLKNTRSTFGSSLEDDCFRPNEFGYLKSRIRAQRIATAETAYTSSFDVTQRPRFCLYYKLTNSERNVPPPPSIPSLFIRLNPITPLSLPRCL